MNLKDSKFLLVQWCNSKNVHLKYNVTPKPFDEMQFMCELTADGIEYIGFGRGITKKSAQTSAAADMFKYLVDIGKIKLPEGHLVKAPDSHADPIKKETPSKSKGPATTKKPSPHAVPIKKEEPSTSKPPATSKKKVKFCDYKEDEDFKADPTLHGNWKMDNCRFKLNEYCGLRNYLLNYKYYGSSRPKSKVLCEVHLYIESINKNLHARKYAFEKEIAAKLCALSIVRQLYHLGEIGPEGVPDPLKSKNKKIPHNLEDEDFKADPSLHGNWSIDNCKAKLHDYCMLRHLPIDYKSTTIRLQGGASKHVWEFDLYVESLNKTLHARKSVGSKSMSTKLCALSIVRQLYHLGEIGPEGVPDPLSLKSKKLTDEPDSNLHGNWSINNSTDRLSEYCRLKNLPLDYKFSTVSLPECKSKFACEVHLYVESVNKTLHACKRANNVLLASKLCARSIVRQLYHLGEIEANSLPDKKETFLDKADQLEVSVDKDIIEDIDKYLKAYGIEPVKVPEINEEPLCLVLENNTEKNVQNKPHTAGVVSWLPPQPRWNPWTRSVIDEGSFADLSLPDISELLKLEYDYRVENDADVQKMLDDQKKFPIYQFKEDILYASYQNRVIIINGLPDCGKTTQVPQYILNAYLQANCGAKCSIVVTQPLCLHAVSAAEKVAKERVESPGNTVGFDVKFESCLPRPYGSILYCNASVLLRKLENGMRGVSHVIVDNIQEKELFTDFTMAVLRDMVNANPELRVILMCSLSDVTVYYEYFGRCPVIEITVPSFPVKEYFLEDCIELMNYVPPKKPPPDLDDEMKQVNCVEDDQDMNKIIDSKYSEATREAMVLISEKEVNYDLVTALLKYIVGLEDNGTVLIVVPDLYFIRGFIKHLKELPDFNYSDYSILPLHDCITREELYKILEPVQDNIRKIIVATQVAETSVLVNDVVYVIDCNRVRKLLSPVTNKQLYFIYWASKENLHLRKSKASSVKPGCVFNVCSQARFEKLADHRRHEMCFSIWYEICLLVKFLNLGDVTDFLSKVIDPPKGNLIKAEDILRNIGAFDCFNELTSLGKLLARLPLEPHLGKMIIMSCIFRIAEPLCFIAAYESCSYFIQIKEWHSKIIKFRSDKPSDHLTTLNILMSWEEKFKEGEKAAEQFCEEYSFVHEIFLNIYNAKNYLKDLLISAGFPKSCFEPQAFRFTGDDKRLDLVLACLCAGYYPNVSMFIKSQSCISKEHLTPMRVNVFSIMRLQPNFKAHPSPYVVFTNLVRHKITVIRDISVISPLILLLFGCKRAEYANGKILVEKWTQFQSSAQDIAKILALHSPIQDLVSEVSGNPKILTHLRSEHTRLLGLIKSICRTHAFSINWLEKVWKTAAAEKTEEIGDLPAKKRKLDEDADSGDTTSEIFTVDTKDKFCLKFKPVKRGFHLPKNVEGEEHTLGMAKTDNYVSYPTALRSQEGNISDQVGKQSENSKYQKNFDKQNSYKIDRNHWYNPSLFSGPNAKRDNKLENQKNELSVKNIIYQKKQEDKINTPNVMQKSFRHKNISFNEKDKGFMPKIENMLTLEEKRLKALTLFSKYLSEQEAEKSKNENEVIQKGEPSGQIENFNKTSMEESNSDEAICKNSVGHPSALGSSDDCSSANLKNQEGDVSKLTEFSGQIESLEKNTMKEDDCNVISKDNVGQPSALSCTDGNLSRNFRNEEEELYHQIESLSKNTSKQPVQFTEAKSSVFSRPINQSVNTSKQSRDRNEMSENNVDLLSTLSCSEESTQPSALSCTKGNLCRNFRKEEEKFYHQIESLSKNTSKQPVQVTVAKSSLFSLPINQSVNTSKQSRDHNKVSESNVELPCALSCSEESTQPSALSCTDGNLSINFINKKEGLYHQIESLNKNTNRLPVQFTVAKSSVFSLPNNQLVNTSKQSKDRNKMSESNVNLPSTLSCSEESTQPSALSCTDDNLSRNFRNKKMELYHKIDSLNKNTNKQPVQVTVAKSSVFSLPINQSVNTSKQSRDRNKMSESNVELPSTLSCSEESTQPIALSCTDGNLSRNFRNEKEKLYHQIESLSKNTSKQPVQVTVAKSSVFSLPNNQSVNTSKQSIDCNEMSESNVELPSTLSCSEQSPIISNQGRDETQIGIFSTLYEIFSKNKGEPTKLCKDISKAFVDLSIALSSHDKSVSTKLNDKVEDFSTSTVGEIGLSLQNSELDRNFGNDMNRGYEDQTDRCSGDNDILFVNQKSIHGNLGDQSNRTKSHVGYESVFSTQDDSSGARLQYSCQQNQKKDYEFKEKVYIHGPDVVNLEEKDFKDKSRFFDGYYRKVSFKKRFDNTSDRFDSHREKERSSDLDKCCTRRKRVFSGEGDVYGGQVSDQDFGIRGDQYKMPEVHKRFSGKKDSYKSLEKDFIHQSKGYHFQKEGSFEDQVSRFVNQVRRVTEIEDQLERKRYKSERTDIKLGSQVDRYKDSDNSQLDDVGSAESCSNYEYFSNHRDVRKERNVNSSRSMYGNIQKRHYYPSTREVGSTRRKEYFGFHKVSSYSKKYQSHRKYC